MARALMGAAAAALVLASGGGAQGAVTVVGGGLAQACSQAVQAGRADQQVYALCTASLEQEALKRRDRAGTLVNRGIVALRMSDADEALRDFRRAENLNPLIGEIFVNRGAALIGKSRYAEAVAEIDKGIALGIDEPHKAYFNRALAREGLDDMKGAYFDYKTAVRLDPGFQLAQTQLTRFTVVTR